jgi:hypothetical protein
MVTYHVMTARCPTRSTFTTLGAQIPTQRFFESVAKQHFQKISIAMLGLIRTDQNPKENGGAKRRHSLLGFIS